MTHYGSTNTDSTTDSTTEHLRQAAAEHPLQAAGLSLLTTPMALKAGSVALRWARRNPGLALAVAAGALAWWGMQARRQAGIRVSDSAGGRRSSGGDRKERPPGGDYASRSYQGEDPNRFFSAAGSGRPPGADGASRSVGGDSSSASSL